MIRAHEKPAVVLLLPLFFLTACITQEIDDEMLREFQRKIEKLEKDMAYVQTRVARLEKEAGVKKKPKPPKYVSSKQDIKKLHARCEEKDGRFRVTKEEAEEVGDNKAGLMMDMRFIPYTAEGEIKGMKLYGIKANSFPGSCGIRNGDIVMEINGRTVADPDGLLGFCDALKKDGEVHIKIVRSDKDVDLYIAIEEQ